MEQVIPTTINERGIITIKLTQNEFEDIRKAVIAHNKRRILHRKNMALRSGRTESKQIKIEYSLAYPIKETRLNIQ